MKSDFKLRVKVTKADIQKAKRAQSRGCYNLWTQNPLSLATNRSMAEAIKNKEVVLPKSIRTEVAVGTVLIYTAAKHIMATRYRLDVDDYVDRFFRGGVRPKSFRLSFVRC